MNADRDAIAEAIDDARALVGEPRRPVTSWCFCKDPGCEGWNTYLAQHREALGADPDAADIKLDSAVQGAVKDLMVRHEALGSPDPLRDAIVELFGGAS